MRKLRSDEIDVKIKQVFEKGVVCLLYKTARVDMAILDETYGAMNWQTDYKTVKDNLYCGIGVFDETKSQWVWKWDCGIESRADGEGNEKKGEASDSFKRAGFKWGIGVELYSSPFIFIPCETVAKEFNGKKSFYQKDKRTKYHVDGIWYDGDEIGALVLKDQDDAIVFTFKKNDFVATRENKM